MTRMADSSTTGSDLMSSSQVSVAIVDIVTASFVIGFDN